MGSATTCTHHATTHMQRTFHRSYILYIGKRAVPMAVKRNHLKHHIEVRVCIILSLSLSLSLCDVVYCEKVSLAEQSGSVDLASASNPRVLFPFWRLIRL